MLIYPPVLALENYVRQQFSDDDSYAVEYGSDNTTLEIQKKYVEDNLDFTLILEADNDQSRFWVYILGPENVLASRVSEMACLLNRVNLKLGLGRFACFYDSEMNFVQYMAAVDCEGSGLALEQVDALVASAFYAFRTYGSAINCVATTDTSHSECLD